MEVKSGMRIGLARQGLMLATLMLGIGACATGKSRLPPSFADLGVTDRYVVATSPHGDMATDDTVELPVNLERWWQSFQDPVLDALVERARTGNLDVLIAAKTARNSRKSVDVLRNRIARDIARNYIELRGRQAMLENIRDFLDQRQATIRLAGFRAQARLAPVLDVARAVANYDEVAARIVDLDAGNRQDAAAIAVLTGQPPQDLVDLLDGRSEIPRGPASVALGKPSDLRLPPLDRRVQSGLATLVYKRAVTDAVRHIEARYAAFEAAKRREKAIERAVDTADTAALLTRKAYGEGLADYSSLEHVEASQLSMHNALRLAQTARALALTDLYVAQNASGLGDSVEPETPGG